MPKVRPAIPCLFYVGGTAMPLTMRRTNITGQPSADPDYCVYSGGLCVGRMYEDITTNQPQSRWLWAINGVHAGPDVMQITGRAATLDAAKEQLRANWNKWLGLGEAD